MRLQAIIPLTLAALTGCVTTTEPEQTYAKANSVVAAEITRRISDIQFQHRGELLENLMWLAQAGEQAIPYLLEAVHHQEPKVRANAAWVLGRIKDRRVIGDLQSAANDSNQTVRLEVARTLVTLGDIKFAPALIEGLDSDRPAVRYNCHQALKESTGRDFGYDHLAESAVDRQRAVLRWRQWWGDQFQDPWFASSYAQAHGIDGTAPERPAMPAAPMTEMAPNPQGEQTPATQGRQGPQTQQPQQTSSPSTGSTDGSSTMGSATTGTGTQAMPVQPANPGTQPSGQPSNTTTSQPSATPTGAPSSAPAQTPSSSTPAPSNAGQPQAPAPSSQASRTSTPQGR